MYKKKHAKKKLSALITLPPGRSTENFSDARGLFQLKEIRSSVSSVFKAYRAGQKSNVEPYDFSPLQISEKIPEEILELIEKAKLPSFEEEILFDLEFDEINDIDRDDLILDMDDEDVLDEIMDADFVSPDVDVDIEGEDEKGICQEMTKLNLQTSIFKKIVKEYPLEDLSLFWLDKATGDLVASEENIFSEEQVEQAYTNIASMASLCFQIFDENFEIDYVSVETEKDSIFFVNHEETGGEAIGISKNFK